MLIGDLLPVFQKSLLCPSCYDYLEDGGSRLFQNICNKLPLNTVISQKSVIFNFHSNRFSWLMLEPVDSQIQKGQADHYSILSLAWDNLQTVLSCINPSVMVGVKQPLVFQWRTFKNVPWKMGHCTKNVVNIKKCQH